MLCMLKYLSVVAELLNLSCNILFQVRCCRSLAVMTLAVLGETNSLVLEYKLPWTRTYPPT